MKRRQERRFGRRTLMQAGAAGIGGAVAAAAVTACEPGLPGAKPGVSQATGSITIWGSNNHREIWKSTEAEYKQRFPNITVRLDQLAVPQGSTADDVILAAVAADSSADVWVHDVTPSWSQGMVEKKALLPLDEYFSRNPFMKKVFPWAQKMTQVNGKKWGFPHEVEYIAVFYNKPALERVNVRQIPEKWDEYVRLGGLLKTAGMRPQAANGMPNYGHMFSLMMAGRMGRTGQEELLYKEGRWDGQGPLDVAKAVRDLQAAGILPTDPLGPDAPKMPGDFHAGKVGVWFTGTWVVAGLDRDKGTIPGFDYDHAPVPALAGNLKPQLAMGLGGGLHVWVNTRQREAAVGWGENNLYTPTAQRVWMESFFEIVPIPFKPEDFNVTAGARTALKLLSQPGDLALNMMPLVSGTFRPFFWATSQELMEAKIGVSEWGSKLQRQWDQEKREGKVPRQ